MKLDTKAIREEADEADRLSPLGPAVQCFRHVRPLCDRVEALERALRDVLSVQWETGGHPKTVGKMALNHARETLEGGE